MQQSVTACCAWLLLAGGRGCLALRSSSAEGRRLPGGSAQAAPPRVGRAAWRPSLASAHGDTGGDGAPKALTLRLRNVFNAQYHGEVYIGGQRLLVIFDTGSFDLLTLSTLCSACGAHAPTYDAGLSQTFRPGSGHIEDFPFLSGTVQARQDFESVIVGSSSSHRRADGMPFWQVVGHNLTVWDDPLGGQFSAIVGLCHPGQVPAGFAMPEASAETLLGRLGIERFAFCLEAQPQAPGWLTLGLPAELPTDLGFRTVPVVVATYWAAKVTRAAVGSVSLTLCTPSCAAIVDSGTSVLLLPRPVLNALENVLNTSASIPPPLAGTAYPCGVIDRFPDLVFEMGDSTFTIPPSAYMVQDSGLGGDCVLAARGIDRKSTLGPIWLLGLPFLRHYYTIFDRAGPSLHVAKTRVHCPADLTGLTRFWGEKAGTVAAPVRMDTRAVRTPVWATHGASAPPLRL
mmetsp:Transcript_33431/g.92526  ORF Transcript_33431/g.92526 Transcript_33431/m.92526 type:complete len:457 (-) Transcript_33431:106-1476(-)